MQNDNCIVKNDRYYVNILSHARGKELGEAQPILRLVHHETDFIDRFFGAYRVEKAEGVRLITPPGFWLVTHAIERGTPRLVSSL